MAEKLGIGSVFPSLTVNLVGGGTLDLPDGLDTNYKVILFYRGHWCPFCRHQLDDFEEHRSELEALGASIVAASVDDEEKAGEIATGKDIPFGYGVSRADADALGSWWEERRGIMQPSEFLLNAENKVMASSYSDGPLGRIDAADLIKFINFVEAQKARG